MLSNHLAWKDLRGDEFGSWSEDIVFLLEHALGRWHRNEKGVYLIFINPHKARDIYGNPVAFYRALKLYENYKIPGYRSMEEVALRAILVLH